MIVSQDSYDIELCKIYYYNSKFLNWIVFAYRNSNPNIFWMNMGI